MRFLTVFALLFFVAQPIHGQHWILPEGRGLTEMEGKIRFKRSGGTVAQDRVQRNRHGTEHIRLVYEGADPGIAYFTLRYVLRRNGPVAARPRKFSIRVGSGRRIQVGRKVIFIYVIGLRSETGRLLYLRRVQKRVDFRRDRHYFRHRNSPHW